MAVAMIGPKFYAWDKNGKPLAFGKLYTYQARTNNPKDTYQSEDQIVPNTNPVILNGEGYANVYLSGSYKMVLKDDKDNEIWTSDPVSSAEPSEWVLCLTATHVSSTILKVNGNFVEQYSPGRRVRIDNNASEYSYSTIKSSVFSASETTIELTDAVVTTGIEEVCASIVTPESQQDISKLTTLTFDSVEKLKSMTGGNGIVVELKAGFRVGRYYYENGDAGYAMGTVKTAAQASADGDVIDGYYNVTLANGNYWIGDKTNDPRKYGAKGNGEYNDTPHILAMSSSLTNGVGVNQVRLGKGVFRVDYIALRGIELYGEGWDATIIKASVTPNPLLISTRLNLDGSTANTEGNGGVYNLTVDCNNENTTGLDLYGGFCGADNVQVINSAATNAAQLVYVLMTNIGRIYSRNNAGTGFLIDIDSPLHDGDVNTSIDLSNLWSNNNGGYGVVYKNINYSRVTGVTTQANTLGGHRFLGGEYSLAASYSITFDVTASEGDLGEPFYFQKVRNLTLIAPFIIGGGARNLITFDNCTGTVINFDSEQGTDPGFYQVSIINAPSQACMTFIGGDFTMDSAQLSLADFNNSVVNGVRYDTVTNLFFNDATSSNRTSSKVEDVDGFGGLVTRADDGTRLQALRRIGTPIFGTNGAINVPATNLALGEVSFYATDAAVVFDVRCPDGSVRTGSIPLA